MIDLMSATQAAFYAALAAAAPAGWPVYDQPPEGTEPNFIRLGAISTVTEAAKDEQEEKLSVEVQVLYRGGDRTVMMAAMHAVRAALDGEPIASDGVSFAEPRFLDAHASDSAADGVTFAGIVNFEVFAEPA